MKFFQTNLSMTYKDDWEIIKNSTKSLAAATVDSSVALIQDVQNVSTSLYANTINNFAKKEDWQEAFSTFWEKAWSKQGGVSDMLIDLANETFVDIFLSRAPDERRIISDHVSIEEYKQIKEIISTFKIGKVNFKKEVLQSNFKMTNERVYHSNSAIDRILDAGPLLYSNMFDVAFVISKRNTDAKDGPASVKKTIVFLKNKLDLNSDVESEVRNELFNISNFSARCSAVTIPLAQLQTTPTKFLEHSIERAGTFVNFDNSSSITIDMDANLYFLDFFQSLAGHRPNYGYSFSGSKVWSDTPAQAANLIGNSDYILDLVVSSRSLGSFHALKYNPTTEAGDWANICYVFQDVRFLGTGPVKFSRDSNAIFSCTFDFIFRSLETIYKSNQGVKAINNNDVILNQRLTISDSGLGRQAIVDTKAGKNLYRS